MAQTTDLQQAYIFQGLPLSDLEKESVFIPELFSLFKGHLFSLPPLREHKREIQSPRSADSFLVASLGVVYFLLVRHHEFLEIIQAQSFLSITNISLSSEDCWPVCLPPIKYFTA